MLKTIDCVEMKRQIQEKLWIEGGETFDGLINLLNHRRKSNRLLKKLMDRKEKENRQSAA